MIERRAGIELRAEDGGRRLSGYIAKWRVEARIAGRFIEVVLPGAFSRSLSDGRDILGLMDHDLSKLLARTSNHSLELHEDSIGLAFSLTLPDTQLGRDCGELARIGSLGGCSFAFHPPVAGDDAWPTPDRREIHNVNMREVSIISSFPAYPQTEVHARHQTEQLAAAAMLRRRRWLATL